jgi:hypothetical protein
MIPDLWGSGIESVSSCEFAFFVANPPAPRSTRYWTSSPLMIEGRFFGLKKRA